MLHPDPEPTHRVCQLLLHQCPGLMNGQRPGLIWQEKGGAGRGLRREGIQLCLGEGGQLHVPGVTLTPCGNNCSQLFAPVGTLGIWGAIFFTWEVSRHLLYDTGLVSFCVPRPLSVLINVYPSVSWLPPPHSVVVLHGT